MGRESFREECVCLQICVQCVETKGQIRVSLLRHHPPCLLKPGLSRPSRLSSRLQELLAFASQCLDYRLVPTPIPGFLFCFVFKFWALNSDLYDCGKHLLTVPSPQQGL